MAVDDAVDNAGDRVTKSGKAKSDEAKSDKAKSDEERRRATKSNEERRVMKNEE
ncbi:hypothetical protein BDZ91DRAFT_844756 [Kalaharituber pfeilii]|nr:hypothetical protein BDZ91DRAFT_844756 [Kalaharituber pfeilii]